MDRKPYTYLIGWSKLDFWYYGVRWAKRCSPDDLWVRYFSSSERVARIRIDHGEPDVVQVRRTFDDKEKAIDWEYKVLRRCNAVRSVKWLNACARGSSFAGDEIAWAKTSAALMGKRKSAEATVNIGNAQRRPEQRKLRSDNFKGTMRYCLSDGTYFARLKMDDPRIKELSLIPQVTTMQRESGRSHAMMMAQTNVGTTIYNNGAEEIKRLVHPGEGWVEGRLPRSTTHQEAHLSAVRARLAGTTTWTDGNRNYRLSADQHPEPHWTRGMAPRRKK